MPPRLTGTLEKLTTDLQARPSFVRSTDKSVLLIFFKKEALPFFRKHAPSQPRRTQPQRISNDGH